MKPDQEDAPDARTRRADGRDFDRLGDRPGRRAQVAPQIGVTIGTRTALECLPTASAS